MAGTIGNNNSSLENRAWRKAVLRHQAQNPELVARIVAKQFNKAEKGDIQAFKAITEISDGKPMQQTEITGANGGAIEIVKIERTIKDPKNVNP